MKASTTTPLEVHDGRAVRNFGLESSLTVWWRAKARAGKRHRTNPRNLDHKRENTTREKVLALYLDTAVLLATACEKFINPETTLAAGAMMASFLLFFVLGYGAGLLRSALMKPLGWRGMTGLIALALWRIALKVLMP